MDKLQKPDHTDFELICYKCGICCGAYDGDPCEHLTVRSDGSYSCRIYTNRFGKHHTINGIEMECVPILEILRKEGFAGDHLCAYRDYLLLSGVGEINNKGQ